MPYVGGVQLPFTTERVDYERGSMREGEQKKRNRVFYSEVLNLGAVNSGIYVRFSANMTGATVIAGQVKHKNNRRTTVAISAVFRAGYVLVCLG